MPCQTPTVFIGPLCPPLGGKVKTMGEPAFLEHHLEGLVLSVLHLDKLPCGMI